MLPVVRGERGQSLDTGVDVGCCNVPCDLAEAEVWASQAQHTCSAPSQEPPWAHIAQEEGPARLFTARRFVTRVSFHRGFIPWRPFPESALYNFSEYFFVRSKNRLKIHNSCKEEEEDA